jgi:hypothetical protein
MPKLPKTPRGMYNEINREFFGGELPDVEVMVVENHSEGSLIDTREEAATVAQSPDGKWIMSINAGLLEWPKYLYFVIAHEAVHIKVPNASHGSKDWNHEVRKLQGAGFFKRIFNS